MPIEDRIKAAAIRSARNDLMIVSEKLDRAGLGKLARDCMNLRGRIIRSGVNHDCPVCYYCQGTGLDPDNLGKHSLKCPVCKGEKKE